MRGRLHVNEAQERESVMAPYRARMIARLVLAVSLALQLGALYASPA
jgi:hypothetical protein